MQNVHKTTPYQIWQIYSWCLVEGRRSRGAGEQGRQGSKGRRINSPVASPQSPVASPQSPVQDIEISEAICI
ncbi:hypothetical protein [Dendronalium sp. ChiSLP03b]|uniref:hypothetical protein n=1 Tax=Dendronalium sp. ChiSLP03b TaxID=3075381 RepID=UPI002AD6A86E|nr:hypothetical protein [Dendronalium sp. ChiSLP03b]